MAFRVGFGDSLLATPSAVVKFSKQEYALRATSHIKLATPRYYREIEGKARGIGDEMEASYVKEMDLDSFLGERKYQVLDGTSSSFAELTLATSNLWMFCTSVKPDTCRELRKLSCHFPEYDCATTISDPSKFAKRLGVSFGRYSSWADVKLSSLDRMAIKLRPAEIGDKVVWVRHGRVVYTDDPSRVVERLPEDHRAAMMPFVKRAEFKDQIEYRFTVSMNGEPEAQEFCLPVSEQLRVIAETEEIVRNT